MRTAVKVIAAIFVLVAVLFTVGYKADIAVEDLKQHYANQFSKFMEVDGVQVHYRIEGSGHPLVLVHGTGASLHTWDGWTEALKDSFQIIRMDIPAFGLTGPNNTGDYSPEYYVRFLNQFIRQLNIDTFYLAGNSLGGTIAWNYAADFPAQVRKLILLDAGGVPHEDDMPMVFKLARNPFSAFLLKNVLPRIFIEKNLKEVYFDDNKITEGLIDRYHHLSLREGNREAFIDRANIDFLDTTEKLSTINCPTLIMWGRHDEWCKLEDGYFFEEKIPGAELVIYENVGHVPMEEIPVLSSQDARLFLSK